MDYRFLHADGKVGWACSRAVPILNDEGEILEWFGAASDITERKEAEEQLREMSRSVEQRVAQLQSLAAEIGSIEQRERPASCGGSMSIDSLPGEGARVVLEAPFFETPEPLPGGNAHSGTGMEGPLANSSADRGIRILIAGDHAMAREGLVGGLAADSWMIIVAEASDGREAVDAIAQHRPDLVLMDLNMPNMNGIEAAREISRAWPETLIIGLSVQDD